MITTGSGRFSFTLGSFVGMISNAGVGTEFWMKAFLLNTLSKASALLAAPAPVQGMRRELRIFCKPPLLA